MSKRTWKPREVDSEKAARKAVSRAPKLRYWIQDTLGRFIVFTIKED